MLKIKKNIFFPFELQFKTDLHSSLLHFLIQPPSGRISSLPVLGLTSRYIKSLLTTFFVPYPFGNSPTAILCTIVSK